MDQLMQLEIQITLFFQHLGSWLAIPSEGITFLGNEFFYILIMPAFYWCVDAALGFRMGIMLVLTTSINGYLKVLFHSPRPFWVDPKVKAYVSETSFGLPSGHSQNAAAIWGILAASVKKRWLTVVCVIAIFLIGLSRIFLGVHFTRDVIAGWLIGILLVILYLLLEKPIVKGLAKRSTWFKIILSLLVSFLLIGIGYLINSFAANQPLPPIWINQSIAAGVEAPAPYSQEGIFTVAGVLFGFTAGYAWLLAKKGSIAIKGTPAKRVYRYLIGIAGVGVLYIGLKLIFPVSPEWLGFGLRYVRYALIGLWISAVAPMLFEKLHLDV
ncbi:MAG: phosphatase PAP2 family protein [Anaerolineaceae bacterium]